MHKLTIILAIACYLPAYGQTWSLKNSRNANSSSGTVTTVAFANALTNGSVEILAVRGLATAFPVVSITETAGNSWVGSDCGPGAVPFNTSGYYVELFCVRNTHTTASNVFTVTMTGAFAAYIDVVEFLPTTPLTALHIEASYGSAANQTLVTGGTDVMTLSALTTSVSKDLVFAIFGNQSGGSPTAGTGWSSIYSGNAMLTEWMVQSSAGALTATASFVNNNIKWAGAAVAIKPENAPAVGSASITCNGAVCAGGNLQGFGSQAVGTTSSAQTITLTNIGGATLTVTDIALSGTNSGDFAFTPDRGANCGGTMAAGVVCNVAVRFTPSDLGSRTATLTFTDDSGGTPGTTQAVGISGVGTGAPAGSGNLAIPMNPVLPNARYCPAPQTNCVDGVYVTTTQSDKYQVVLSATGGTPPYTWTVTGLPTGLTYHSYNYAVASVENANGKYDSAGAFTACANSACAGLPWMFTGFGLPANNSSADPYPVINTRWVTSSSTSVLTTGNNATTSVENPASGRASVGFINGIASQTGTFTVTVKVDDSDLGSPHSLTKTFSLTVFDQQLDEYNGVVGAASAAACNGAANNFYTKKTGNRWYLCDPRGNAYWHNAVWEASNTYGTPAYTGKYATGPFVAATGTNWSLNNLRRLSAWGFTGMSPGYLASNQPDTTGGWGTNGPTIKMPIVAELRVNENWKVNTTLVDSNQVLIDPVKDIAWPIFGRTWCGVSLSVGAPSCFHGDGLRYPDMLEPKMVDYYNAWWDSRPTTSGIRHLARSALGQSWLIGFYFDETDNITQMWPGSNFGRITAGTDANNPFTEIPYGAVAMCTPPYQTSNNHSGMGATYANKTVFSKMGSVCTGTSSDQAWSCGIVQWMSNRYSGDIGAFNAAWGSNYSQWAPDSADGSSWGTGKGFADEDGTCPSKPPAGTCWIPLSRNGYGFGNTPGAQFATQRNDLIAFSDDAHNHWFANLNRARDHINTDAAQLSGVTQHFLNFGHYSLSNYGIPSYSSALKGAFANLDVVSFSYCCPVPCPNCTQDDIDNRTAFAFGTAAGNTFTANKPAVAWRTLRANPDSSAHDTSQSSCTVCFDCQGPKAGSCTGTQPGSVAGNRGDYYAQKFVPLFYGGTDASGVSHMIGSEYFGFSDNCAAGTDPKTNWGFVTCHDNPYDGVSTGVVPMVDPWGYQAGGALPNYTVEDSQYGDVISGVVVGNTWVLDQLGGAPAPQVCSLVGSPFVQFGSTTVGASLETTIFNSGGDVCTGSNGGSLVAGISLTGDFVLETVYTTTPCGTSLAAGAGCTVKIITRIKELSASGSLTVPTNTNTVIVPVTAGPIGAQTAGGAIRVN